MATGQTSDIIQHLRRAVLLRDGAGLTDRQLLEEYINRREEAALAALVRRHGPMVWGVCRRVLRNHHDAEDAFQATSLVLVRKAASITSPELLANWLYGVAHQTALKARATAAKRRVRERQVTEMPEPAVTEQDLWNDLQPLLDQALSCLPDKYRVAIVLCELEGKTRKEAARQLGVPEGTLGARLARGRVMLAKRLARHGLAVSGGVMAALLSQAAASGGVPTSVVSSTIKAASRLAAGGVAASVVSAKVAALTEGVLKAMLLTKLQNAVAVLVVLGILSGGAILLIQPTLIAQQTEFKKEPPPPAAASSRDKQPVERASFDQVKATLAQQRAKLKSLYIEYKIDTEPLVADKKLLVKWMLAGIPLKYEEHAAMKGDKRYIKTNQKDDLEPFGPNVIDPDAPAPIQAVQKERVKSDQESGGPFTAKAQVNTYGFDGKKHWRRTEIPGAQLFPAPLTDDYPGPASILYLENIGLAYLSPAALAKNVRDKNLRSNNLTFLLPEAFEGKAYQILNETQKIDGAECVVIEARFKYPKGEGTDKLWLDVKHGFALRKRDFTADGLLVMRVLNSKFEEVIPGLWLPRESRKERGGPSWGPKEFRNRPVLAHQMSVIRWSANDVDDQLFEDKE